MRKAAVQRVPVEDLCSLWAETPTTPMHIALLGTVDAGPLTDSAGAVRMAVIRSAVEGHLDSAHALRRVLLRTRLGQGGAAWVDATDFRIEDHVVPVHAPDDVRNENELRAWCARRSLLPLDRARPLWRMDVIPGFPEDRVGVLVVLHHVVADGLRGVSLLSALLDTEPQPRPAPPPRWRPAPPPSAARLVRDGAAARWTGLTGVRRGNLIGAVGVLGGLRRERGREAPPSPLAGCIGSGRRLEVVRRPLDELRAAGHAFGCTVNDLLLAAVTHGLRDALTAWGRCPDGLVLLASVPVGARTDRAGGMMIVPLPVGTADPRERLRLITPETARGKARPDEGVAGIVAMPATLAHLGVLWARRTASSHINLYVTNVPGPPTPLYLAGARLRDVVPLAPLVAGVRLSVTALSYDGTLSVALLANDSISDLHVVAEGTREAFDAYATSQLVASAEART
jgi:diacylglycerol O-acyltransferase / wax synthase